MERHAGTCNHYPECGSNITAFGVSDVGFSDVFDVGFSDVFSGSWESLIGVVGLIFAVTFDGMGSIPSDTAVMLL